MTLYIQHNHAHEKITPINIDPPLYGIFSKYEIMKNFGRTLFPFLVFMEFFYKSKVK